LCATSWFAIILKSTFRVEEFGKERDRKKGEGGGQEIAVARVTELKYTIMETL